SQVSRRKKNPQKQPGNRYKVRAYCCRCCAPGRGSAACTCSARRTWTRSRHRHAAGHRRKHRNPPASEKRRAVGKLNVRSGPDTGASEELARACTRRRIGHAEGGFRGRLMTEVEWLMCE